MAIASAASDSAQVSSAMTKIIADPAEDVRVKQPALVMAGMFGSKAHFDVKLLESLAKEDWILALRDAMIAKSGRDSSKWDRELYRVFSDSRELQETAKSLLARWREDD